MNTFECNQIKIFISSLYQTTSTLWVSGKNILLVDPNWLPSEIDYIRQYLEPFDHSHKQWMLFTHADYDHILGYGAFQPAEVITSQTFASEIDKVKAIQAINDWDSEHYITRSYPIVYPNSSIVIHTDQELKLDCEFELQLALTPGHTIDGLAAYIPSQKTLIAGDYLSPLEFPFIEDNIESYKRTLLKFETISLQENVEWVIPGHGNPYPGDELGRIIDRDMTYLTWIQENPEMQFEDIPQEFNKQFPFIDSMRDQHTHNLSVARL